MKWLYIKYFILPKFSKEAYILEIGDGSISKQLEKLGYENYYIVGDRQTIRKNIKSPFIYTIDHEFDNESFDLIIYSIKRPTQYRPFTIYTHHALKKDGYILKGYKLCQK